MEFERKYYNPDLVVVQNNEIRIFKNGKIAAYEVSTEFNKLCPLTGYDYMNIKGRAIYGLPILESEDYD